MKTPTPRRFPRRRRIAAVISLCGVLLLIAMGIAARVFLSSAASRAAVKDFVTTLNQQRGRAQAAVAASRATDPISPVNIENGGEIDRRLALLQDAAAANRTALDLGDRWSEDLTARLKRAGATSLEISRWQKRFREQYDWDQSRPVYATRQRVVELQIAMLKFLHDHRDGWGILDAVQGVHFYNHDLRREYDSLLQEYANAVLAEQQTVGKNTPGR